MFNFNNPGQGADLKAYYLNFYNQNKRLVILMAASLVLLLVGRSNLFNILYYVYLVYFGGFILRSYLGEYKLLLTYLFSGVAGLFTFLVFFGLNEVNWQIIEIMIGSAAIGLLTAAATLAPNMEIMLVFIGRTKIKWVALILIAMDMLSLFGLNKRMPIAHIGAILYGFWSIYASQNRRFQWPMFKIPSFFQKKGPYYDRSKANQSHTRVETDEAYRTRKVEEEKEINRILDKIKSGGYGILSAEEKQKLFDKSKKDA
jgi:hypothetical protein